MENLMKDSAKEAELSSAFLKASESQPCEEIRISAIDVITLDSMYDSTYHDDIHNPVMDVLENSTLHKVAKALSKNSAFLQLVIKKDVFDWSTLNVTPDQALNMFVRSVPDALVRYARRFIVDRVYGEAAKGTLLLSYTKLSDFKFKKLCAFFRFRKEQTDQLLDLYKKTPEFAGAFICAIFERSLVSDIDNLIKKSRREKGHLPDAPFKAADKAGRSQEEVDAIQSLRKEAGIAAVDAAKNPPGQLSNEEIASEIVDAIKKRLGDDLSEDCDVLCEWVRVLFRQYEEKELYVKDIPLLSQRRMLETSIAGAVIWAYVSTPPGEYAHFERILSAVTCADEARQVILLERNNEIVKKITEAEERLKSLEARISDATKRAAECQEPRTEEECHSPCSSDEVQVGHSAPLEKDEEKQ